MKVTVKVFPLLLYVLSVGDRCRREEEKQITLLKNALPCTTVGFAGHIFYWHLPEATKINQYMRDENNGL